MTAVDKMLCGCRAPGVDFIHHKFLKFLDNAGLSWLTCFCNSTWTLRAASLDWHTGVVVPLLKKGCVLNTKG